MMHEIQATKDAVAGLEQEANRVAAELQTTISKLKSIDQRALTHTVGQPYLDVDQRRKIAFIVEDSIERLERLIAEALR